MAYIGRPSIVGNFVKLDSITAVNGQAAYTMQNGGANFTDYSSVNQFMVSLNSVVQSPGSSFTVSGSTLTFASNLSTGDVIDFIIVFGNSLSSGVPTDATVTAAKLTANAITGQTAETSIATDDTILIHDTSASALRKMTRANFVSGIGGTNTPNFSANKTSGTISFGLNSLTKITLDNELYDTASAYDTSNGRFTVPTGQGGKYSFSAHLVLYEESNNNMTGHHIALYINGSLSVYMPYNYSATLGNYKLGVLAAQVNLSVGDYVELYARVYASSGTGRAEVGASYNRFSGFKLIGV